MQNHDVIRYAGSLQCVFTVYKFAIFYFFSNTTAIIIDLYGLYIIMTRRLFDTQVVLFYLHTFRGGVYAEIFIVNRFSGAPQLRAVRIVRYTNF